MKYRNLLRMVAALLLAVPQYAIADSDTILVRGVATYSKAAVILDLFADAGGIPLRSFGIGVKYDPDELSLVSGGRYDALWFLRGEDGVSHPYTDVTIPEPGWVRVVGGRLDGDHPAEGATGDDLLLATLVFKRGSERPPEFSIGLADGDPYVNFAAATSGESADKVVSFGEVVLQEASEDSDNDGLPDDYELATFKGLKTSNGDTDTDSDGDDDRSEWERGTDPLDPESKFKVRISLQADGSKVVVWTGRLGRVYELEWSPDLKEFVTIAAGIPGIGPWLERLDERHNADPRGYYRVRTRFPTEGR